MINKCAILFGIYALNGIALITFLILKLAGAIAISWLWILVPLWIPVLLIGIGIFIASRDGD